jgi:hypothetical protein
VTQALTLLLGNGDSYDKRRTLSVAGFLQHSPSQVLCPFCFATTIQIIRVSFSVAGFCAAHVSHYTVLWPPSTKHYSVQHSWDLQVVSVDLSPILDFAFVVMQCLFLRTCGIHQTYYWILILTVIDPQPPKWIRRVSTTSSLRSGFQLIF